MSSAIELKNFSRIRRCHVYKIVDKYTSVSYDNYVSYVPLWNVCSKCVSRTLFVISWHYLDNLFNRTVRARALSFFDIGCSPLIHSISQIAASSRMKTMWPPHNLVGGIYRATLIRLIKYLSAGTRYTVFVVNGNPALDTQQGSTLPKEARRE